MRKLWVKAKLVADWSTCHRAVYLYAALAYGAAQFGVEKWVVEAILCGLYLTLCARG